MNPASNFLRFFADSRPPPESHTHHHGDNNNKDNNNNNNNNNTSGNLDPRPMTTLSASPTLELLTAAAAEEERRRQLQQAEKIVVWIPELTLTMSLDDLSRAIDVTSAAAASPTEANTAEGKEHNVIMDDKVPASLVKRTKKVPRLIRYKELLKRANYILGYYRKARMDQKMENFTFKSFCYECGRSGGVALEECIGCGVVFYCSRKCRVESWNKGHSEECKMFKSKTGITCVKSKTSKDNWHRISSAL